LACDLLKLVDNYFYWLLQICSSVGSKLVVYLI
jgi:hypothetical protein